VAAPTGLLPHSPRLAPPAAAAASRSAAVAIDAATTALRRFGLLSLPEPPPSPPPAPPHPGPPRARARSRRRTGVKAPSRPPSSPALAERRRTHGARWWASSGSPPAKPTAPPHSPRRGEHGREDATVGEPTGGKNIAVSAALCRERPTGGPWRRGWPEGRRRLAAVGRKARRATDRQRQQASGNNDDSALRQAVRASERGERPATELVRLAGSSQQCFSLTLIQPSQLSHLPANSIFLSQQFSPASPATSQPSQPNELLVVDWWRSMSAIYYGIGGGGEGMRATRKTRAPPHEQANKC
jgi:hypothetical protein